jgi:hypothetical protein
MKFRCDWSIPQDNWLAVLNKFTSMSPQEQVNAGEGVKIIGRWHDAAARKGIAILESDDPAAVQRYLGLWNPHMKINLTPVLDDAEATVVYRQIIAVNQA